MLLIKRNVPPFLDYWALPGGLIRMDVGERGEEPEEAALRVLKKETGLTKDFGYSSNSVLMEIHIETPENSESYLLLILA